MATLILQNSALALVMRYTRTREQTDQYISTTAVVMAEILKVAVALGMQFKVRAPLGHRHIACRARHLRSSYLRGSRLGCLANSFSTRQM